MSFQTFQFQRNDSTILTREHVIVPILQRFGKLNFTYYDKLQQPHYSYRSSTPGAGVEKSQVIYSGTLNYSGTLVYSGYS